MIVRTDLGVSVYSTKEKNEPYRGQVTSVKDRERQSWWQNPLCFFYDVLKWDVLLGAHSTLDRRPLDPMLMMAESFSSSPWRAFDAVKSQIKQLYTISTGYLLTEQSTNNSWRFQISKEWWRMKPSVAAPSHVFICETSHNK